MTGVSERLPDEEFICPVCLSILLEPTTLVCGHNICRGCLAGWYLSSFPRKKECPLCREKWDRCPQVNKTLRNLIERDESQAEVLAKRKEDVSQDIQFMENLHKFEREMQQITVSPGQAKQNHAFFAGAALALAAAVVLYFAVYWGRGENSTGEMLRRPVATWGTQDVSDWLESLGWAHNYTDNAQLNTVDGPALLYLDWTELLSRLGVSNPNHHIAIKEAVGVLRNKGVKMPQTLWEYKALYPGRALFQAYAMKDFPRFTVFFLYLFYYQDSYLPFVHSTVPREWHEQLTPSLHTLPHPGWGQSAMFWLFLLVFPYGLAGLFAWSLRSVHTVTHLLVMATCLFQTFFELSFLSGCVLEHRWRDLKQYVESTARPVFTMAIYICLWPLIPSFVCSFFFYVCLYVSPVNLARKMVAVLTGNQA